MLRTRVIPCLLLRNRALVKTVRFKEPQYVGDPINTVRIFNEKEVDELIFLDITASAEEREPRFELIQEIANECFMPFAYGGGVSTLAQIRTLFKLGVEKVAINSRADSDPDFIRQASQQFGSQSVIASIDVKKSLLGKYAVYSHVRRAVTAHGPVEYAREMERLGAGEILLTSVDRDGTMSGYDLKLIKMVSQAVQIPVVACGGAGGIDDFRSAVDDGGASAVAVGSMVVYQGPNRAVLINFPSRAELETVLG